MPHHKNNEQQETTTNKDETTENILLYCEQKKQLKLQAKLASNSFFSKNKSTEQEDQITAIINDPAYEISDRYKKKLLALNIKPITKNSRYEDLENANRALLIAVSIDFHELTKILLDMRAPIFSISDKLDLFSEPRLKKLPAEFIKKNPLFVALDRNDIETFSLIFAAAQKEFAAIPAKTKCVVLKTLLAHPNLVSQIQEMVQTAFEYAESQVQVEKQYTSCCTIS